MGYGGTADSKKTRQSSEFEEQTSGVQSKKLHIEQDAIDKLLQDALGSADGLAAIFGGEQSSGIFNSSVANQAAGDLVANIVGEIAKLTGQEVITDDKFASGKKRGKSEDTEFSTGAGFGTYSF